MNTRIHSIMDLLGCSEKEAEGHAAAIRQGVMDVREGLVTPLADVLKELGIQGSKEGTDARARAAAGPRVHRTAGGGSVKLEDGLNLFHKEMLAKFRLRDERHGERSVTRIGNALLNEPGVIEGLKGHLDSEVAELHDAPMSGQVAKEAVDVSNIAFLIWWHHQS